MFGRELAEIYICGKKQAKELHPVRLPLQYMRFWSVLPHARAQMAEHADKPELGAF